MPQMGTMPFVSFHLPVKRAIFGRFSELLTIFMSEWRYFLGQSRDDCKIVYDLQIILSSESSQQSPDVASDSCAGMSDLGTCSQFSPNADISISAILLGN
jgi:hypothetical protein